MDKSDGEGFLSRWARLKAKPDLEVPAHDSEVEINAPDISADVGLEENLLDPSAGDDFIMPRLEDITPEGSIAQFLHKKVPEALRQAALRHAWTSDPLIRDFIEVAENQYNFNDPSSIPGWGEIGPDTDMQALLEQATRFVKTSERVGLRDEPNEIIATVSSDMSSLRLSEHLEVKEDEKLELRGEIADEQQPGETETQSPAIPQEPSGQRIAQAGDAPVSLPQRKRHGGALPS